MKRNWRTGTTTTSSASTACTTSSASTAVVPDLNIEVKIVSWLWYVRRRPRCAGVSCNDSRVGSGLTGVDKSHERVQLMVRYLVRESWLTDGIYGSGLFDLQCGHSVVSRHLGGDRSPASHSGRSEGRKAGNMLDHDLPRRRKSLGLRSHKGTLGLWDRCRCHSGGSLD